MGDVLTRHSRESGNLDTGPQSLGSRLRGNDEEAVCELSIVMPCLNEAETLAVCIGKAQAFLAAHHVSGEVVIADNGSTDGSQNIARAGGARVVDVPDARLRRGAAGRDCRRQRTLGGDG